MEDFLLGRVPVLLGVPLPPVGLQRHPHLGVVAAAVGRSLALAVLQEHVCSSRQEEPEETKTTRSHNFSINPGLTNTLKKPLWILAHI